ncbi:hypothetical protein M9458_034757, partial [Cirrhinus mrigala]
REKRIKEIRSGESTESSRDKPVRVTSLKRKPSEQPALTPRPSLTSSVLRNSDSKSDNSSTPSRVPTARSAMLRRNSSGRNDSSVVSRVASGLRRNSSDSDTVTAPDKPSTSVPDSPDDNSEISNAVYKRHYLHNSSKTDHTTSEDEVDTSRQTETSLKVITKSRITPSHLKPSTPDKEILRPPMSKPPEPPSKDEEIVNNQTSEDENLSPSTPPEKPHSSPPASFSDPEETQTSFSIESPIEKTVTTK